jgi:purine nucleoside permease
MALGMDPRFDLTHAYFLINGIAGGDPQVVSLGSAVWTDYVLNDVAREIDSREAPAEWPYGIFAVNTQAPNPVSPGASSWFGSNVYPLNAKLTAWAFAQTKDLKLGDDAKAAAFRAGYTNFANAQRPPFVLVGSTLASNRYWHGTVMTQWARDWVRLFTEGKGTFATTEMEDAGFMAAIARLGAMHRVDAGRVMVLRAPSNYSEERRGQTAIQSVAAPYAGSRLALESAYLCGSTVLHSILAHWDVTYAKIPGE